MKGILFRLILLVITVSFLSGEYIDLSAEEHFTRVSTILLIFSALLLLVGAIQSQESPGVLDAELPDSNQKD